MAAAINLSGARNKLRQAEILYAQLNAVPTACADFTCQLQVLLGAAARATHDSANIGEGLGEVGEPP